MGALITVCDYYRLFKLRKLLLMYVCLFSGSVSINFCNCLKTKSIVKITR